MLDPSDWNAPWVDRTGWIFAHLDSLELEPKEALILLIISFCNDHHMLVTPQLIAQMSHLSQIEADDVTDVLIARGYLRPEMRGSNLYFAMDGLCQAEKGQTPISEDLIEKVAAVFARPMSGMEMERIMQLAGEFSQEEVLIALDEAAAYEKLSIAYVESVLRAWKSRGLSLDELERGRR